jgi:hypothetical protein
MVGGMLMACLRLNGYALDLDQARLFDRTAKQLSCGLRLWRSCSNWGAGMESWLQSAI